MRKFLSILLAVMMVLSTVSFAAPSAIGSVQTADDYVAVEDIPAEEAELEAALAAVGDAHARHGKQIYEDTFDSDIVVAEGWSNLPAMTYQMVGIDAWARQPVDDGTGNMYLASTGAAPVIRFANVHGAKEGYYTLEADVYGLTGTTTVHGCSKEGDYTGVVAFFIDGVESATDIKNTTVAEGTNKNVAVTVDSAAATSGYISFYAPSGTMAFDNVKLYYRPKTVDVTLNVAGQTFTFEDVDTLAAADINALVEDTGVSLGIKIVDGYSVNSVDYDAADALYLTDDVTVDVTLADDPMKDLEKGTTLYHLSFENDGTYTTWNSGAYIDPIAKLGMTEAVDNSDSFNAVNNTGVAGNLVKEGDDTVLKFTSMAAGDRVMLLYSLSPNAYYELAGTGYYTLEFDMKLSNAAANNYFMGRWRQSNLAGGVINYKDINYKTFTANEWVHITQEFDTSAYSWTNGVGYVQMYTILAAASDVYFDDIKLIYKPFTIDVTLVYEGEEYVAEDMSTAGFDVADALAKAGVVAPYGKQLVVSLTENGEAKNHFSFAYDATLYVEAVDDPKFDATHGKQLFEIGFDKYSVGDAIAHGKVSALADTYEADYANTNIYFYGASTIAGDENNKYTQGTSANAQIRIKLDNYASRPDGYYTYVIKTKWDGTSTSTSNFIPIVQNGSDNPAAMWKNSGTVTGGADFAEYVAIYDGPKVDYTWYYGNAGTSNVYFDDIKLYYKPFTIDVTLVYEGEEYVAEDMSTAGFDVADALAKAGVVAPYGKQLVVSLTENGEAKNHFSFAYDATLYVEAVDDPMKDLEKGTALYHLSFENDGTFTTWNNGAFIDPIAKLGMTEAVDNSDSFNAVNNTGVAGNLVKEGDDTVLKFTSMAAGNGIMNVYSLSPNAYYELAGTGYYTLEFDMKLSNAAANNYFMGRWRQSSLAGGVISYKDIYHKTFTANEWVHITQEFDTSAYSWTNGVGYVQMYTMLAEASDVYFDDIKLWFKPFTATLTGTIDGEEFTVTNISTTDSTVASIVAEFNGKSSLLNVTGFTYAGVTYDVAKDADTVVPFPGDFTIELVGEISDLDPNAPITENTASVYVGNAVDDESNPITGVRFKTSFAYTLDPEAYGWAITREAILTKANYTVETAVDALKAGVNFVQGWNYDPEGTYSGEPVIDPVIFKDDGSNIWFTAVLYGIDYERNPERAKDVLVALPITQVGGELHYGTPVATSIYKVAKTVADGGYTGLSTEEIAKIDAIITAGETVPAE